MDDHKNPPLYPLDALAEWMRLGRHELDAGRQLQYGWLSHAEWLLNQVIVHG